VAAVTSLQVPSLTSWQWSPRPGRAPRIVPARATGTVAPWVRDAVPPGQPEWHSMGHLPGGPSDLSR
jgi:hypothetical protein